MSWLGGGSKRHGKRELHRRIHSGRRVVSGNLCKFGEGPAGQLRCNPSKGPQSMRSQLASLANAPISLVCFLASLEWTGVRAAWYNGLAPRGGERLVAAAARLCYGEHAYLLCVPQLIPRRSDTAGQVRRVYHPSGVASLPNRRAATAICCAFVVVLLASSCARRPQPSRPTSAAPPTARTVIQNPTIVYRNREGVPLWTAKARRSTADQATMSIHLDGVQATLYQRGRPAWSCTAPALDASRPAERVTMSGGVRTTSADRTMAFSSPTVTWDIARNVMHGAGGVTLRVHNVILTGKQLEASTETGSWRVFGNAEARLLP